MKRPYSRCPIFIGKHTVAVIHLFTRHDCFEDFWTNDCFHRVEESVDAKQFIDQLEDHWTPAFLIALRDAITERLKEHDGDFGTDFASTK